MEVDAREGGVCVREGKLEETPENDNCGLISRFISGLITGVISDVFNGVFNRLYQPSCQPYQRSY